MRCWLLKMFLTALLEIFWIFHNALRQQVRWMQLSLQARVMKKVCGCLFLFFYFLIFFICPRVCVNRNKCSCVLGWCLLLFVFIWFLCPKRKKREEEIKHLCIVHFHCHATSYVMVTQSIIILDTSSGHPLPFITNIIHKLPLLKLCKEMLTSQACQLDNGVKWASVTVTTSFVSERTFYFWVYHLDIADLRTHINCAWSSQ